MILVFLQVFITPRYKERGFLVSIVKFYGIRRNLGKSSGAFFRKKNSPIFHIFSRRIKSKSIKDLSTACVAHSIILFSSEYSCPSAYNEDPATRLSLPRGEEFFRAQDLSDSIHDRENILFRGGGGWGGPTLTDIIKYSEKKKEFIRLNSTCYFKC